MENTYELTGLTCQHCVNAVTAEVSALPGVESVNIDLVSGGTSTLRVESTSALDEADVVKAVKEADDEYTVNGK